MLSHNVMAGITVAWGRFITSSYMGGVARLKEFQILPKPVGLITQRSMVQIHPPLPFNFYEISIF